MERGPSHSELKRARELGGRGPSASWRSPARASRPNRGFRPSATRGDCGATTAPRSSPPSGRSSATRARCGSGTTGGAGFVAECEPNDGHARAGPLLPAPGRGRDRDAERGRASRGAPPSRRRGTNRPTQPSPSRSTARSPATAATVAACAPTPSRWATTRPAAPRVRRDAPARRGGALRRDARRRTPGARPRAGRARRSLPGDRDQRRGLPRRRESRWQRCGAGGSVIEVNTETTELTGAATVALRGAAGVVLPGLLD